MHIKINKKQTLNYDDFVCAFKKKNGIMMIAYAHKIRSYDAFYAHKTNHHNSVFAMRIK